MELGKSRLDIDEKNDMEVRGVRNPILHRFLLIWGAKVGLKMESNSTQKGIKQINLEICPLTLQNKSETIKKYCENYIQSGRERNKRKKFNSVINHPLLNVELYNFL